MPIFNGRTESTDKAGSIPANESILYVNLTLNDAPNLLFVYLKINNHLGIYSYFIWTFLFAIALNFIKQNRETLIK